VEQTERGEALTVSQQVAKEQRQQENRSIGTAGGDTPAWYAIWTRSHCERLVAQQLSAKAFSPFLPEMKIRSKRPGWPHAVLAPIFPGYLFVRHAMDKASYLEILKARGVVRILEGGWTRLSRIPDSEVDAIRRLIDSGLEILPHPYFRQGDRVRVMEGPLAGLEGVFVREKPNKGRLVLSIDLIRTSVAVELDWAFVEAAARPRTV
jgi:transcription antitermination factor NusG